MNILINNYWRSDPKLFFLVTLTYNNVINWSVMPPGLRKYVLQIMRQSDGMYFYSFLFLVVAAMISILVTSSNS